MGGGALYLRIYTMILFVDNLDIRIFFFIQISLTDYLIYWMKNTLHKIIYSLQSRKVEPIYTDSEMVSNCLFLSLYSAMSNQTWTYQQTKDAWRLETGTFKLADKATTEDKVGILSLIVYQGFGDTNILKLIL